MVSFNTTMVSFTTVRKTLDLLLHVRPIMMSTASLTLATLLLVLLPLSPPRVHGFGVCRNSFRCLNNGTERYGQSIFGPCRCQCPEGYTGPRCQYQEASTPGQAFNSLKVLYDFLHRRLEAERQEEREGQQETEA